MKKHGWDEAQVAAAVELDRSQVNRLRHGASRPSVETAQKLAKLTGIEWHRFIDGAAA